MPRVVVEYELPRDQVALEAAIMGPESARVIARLRQHLERERIAYELKVRAAPLGQRDELVGYLRGVSDALAQLETLARGEGEEDGRRIEAE
jgi:hypothetical protein